jgi:hypothetical protein
MQPTEAGSRCLERQLPGERRKAAEPDDECGAHGRQWDAPPPAEVVYQLIVTPASAWRG